MTKCMHCDKELRREWYIILGTNIEEKIRFILCHECWSDAFDEMKSSYTIQSLLKKINVGRR